MLKLKNNPNSKVLVQSQLSPWLLLFILLLIFHKHFLAEGLKRAFRVYPQQVHSLMFFLSIQSQILSNQYEANDVILLHMV